MSRYQVYSDTNNFALPAHWTLNTFSIFCCYNTTFCFCLQPTKKPFPHSTTGSSSVESHSTHYRSFQGRFYRPHDQTNSVKALKETSWSSRSGLNPSRTTPPCYNNITLGNHLYAERKGPVPMWQTQSVGPVTTAHISVLRTVNIVTQSSTELFW